MKKYKYLFFIFLIIFSFSNIYANEVNEIDVYYDNSKVVARPLYTYKYFAQLLSSSDYNGLYPYKSDNLGYYVNNDINNNLYVCNEDYSICNSSTQTVNSILLWNTNINSDKKHLLRFQVYIDTDNNYSIDLDNLDDIVIKLNGIEIDNSYIKGWNSSYHYLNIYYPIDVDNSSYVDSISLDRDGNNVSRGGSLKLTHSIVGCGDNYESVTYSVMGNTSDDTIINNEGLLTVSEDEESNKLSVSVISNVDSTKVAVSNLNVIDEPLNIDSIKINEEDDVYYRGIEKYFYFTASIEGTADKSFRWEVNGAKSSKTNIDENGILYVSSDETSDKLVVSVISNEFEDRFDSINIVGNDISYIDSMNFTYDNDKLKISNSLTYKEYCDNLNNSSIGNLGPKNMTSSAYYVSSGNSNYLYRWHNNNWETTTSIWNNQIDEDGKYAFKIDAIINTDNGYVINSDLKSIVISLNGVEVSDAYISSYNNVTKKATVIIPFSEDGINRYGVTFVTNGGSSIDNQIIKEGGVATKPSNPTKYGYEFLGWYINNIEYDFSTPVTNHVVLSAKWRELPKYSVSFDANGGSGSMSTISAFEGEYIIPECSFTNTEDYVFKGWSLSKNGELIESFNLEKDTTLYAIWDYDYVSLNETNIKIEYDKIAYKGYELKPDVVVIYNGKTLIQGTNYELEYINNNKVGTASVVIKGLNRYTGTITKKFIIYSLEEIKNYIPQINISNDIDNSIKLTWNSYCYSNKYEIYRSTSKTGKYVLINTVNDTSYIDKSLTYGSTYYYKIVAYNESYNSKYSNIAYMKVVPNKVSNFKYYSVGTNNIKLSWDKVNVSGYELYRSTDNKKWTKITTISKNTTIAYNNTKLTSNKTYYYKIRAYKVVGKTKIYGSYSNIIKVKTSPNKPLFKVSLRNSNSINVKISYVKGASSYQVYRSLNEKTGYELIATMKTYGTYVDKNTEIGKTYYYRVRACNSSNSCSSYTTIKIKQIPVVSKVTLSTSSKVVNITINKDNNVDGYVIYRSTSKYGKYTKISNSVDNIYSDKTTKGKKFYYKVRSYKIVNGIVIYSSYSNIYSIVSK